MKKSNLFQIWIVVFQLIGLSRFSVFGSTNETASTQENWIVISNRWCAVTPDKIKRTAESSNLSAQYFLAIDYLQGITVPRDNTEAFKWMLLAAKQGRPSAERKLACMYESGTGVATNLEEAIVWYERASLHGDAYAQMQLGCMNENGRGLPRDYAKAAGYYLQAAKQGHAMAQNNLGWLYYKGLGVQANLVEAVGWFQKSADSGEKLAMENLALIYAKGAYCLSNVFGLEDYLIIRSNEVTSDPDLAERWMKRAVDLNTAQGQYQFGFMLVNELDAAGHQIPTNYARAAEYFKYAAERGHADAQYELALLYHYGNYSQRSNCIPWFLKAAAQGHAEAQAQVAELNGYYPDSALLKSIDAVNLLIQSAEKGNLHAQYRLSKRYQTGAGVSLNPIKAFQWMQSAARNDTKDGTVGDALFDLGLMYENGEGTQTNLLEARRYIMLATDKGQPDACFRMAQAYEKGDGVTQDKYQAARLYYMAVFNLGGRNYKYQAAKELLRLYAEGLDASISDHEGGDLIDKDLADKKTTIRLLQAYQK